MISNKEKKLLESLISKHEFNHNFNLIKNLIDYDQYVHVEEEKKLPFKLIQLKYILTIIILLCIMIIPCISFSPDQMVNTSVYNEIIIEREIKLTNKIYNERSNESLLVISFNEHNHNKYQIKNLKVIDINSQIIIYSHETRVSKITLNLNGFSTFPNRKIKIVYEICNYKNQTVLEYECIVESYYNSEGIQTFRFLY